jgi:hypothetical protein
MKIKLLAKFTVMLCITFAGINQLSSLLPAQSTYGSIVGTITDPSGGVIPGASATFTNLGTAEKRAGVTDSNGTYRFVNLVPGRYRLEVEAKGFKRLTREPIVVEVQAAVRIDAALQVGNISETVEVTAETPLLQTESSSLSQAIEGRHVADMPLNGRNAMNLIALVPGVVQQGSSAGASVGNQQSATTGTHTKNEGWSNYQVGGGVAGQGATFLDGSPLNVGGGGNSIGLVPVQEAIQEFRVVTSNVSAEFGRFSGGVINMVTKSGSNEWHGSAYEYLRNRVLNANYFFMNAAGKDRGPWVQNQFGGALGGPIRKDKTYFFANVENYVLRVGTPALNTVPTPAMKSGNFSSLLSGPVLTDACGQSYQKGQIFDPVNRVTVAGKTCRVPFAGNIIPSTRYDSTANYMANVKKYWPDPNTNLSGGNYASFANSGGDQQQYNMRIDHNLSDKQRLFGRYTIWHLDDIPFNPLGNFTGNSPSHDTTHHIVIGDSYTFSSTTLLDVRLSYLRQYYDSLPATAGMDIAPYGAAYASLAKLATMPMMPTPNVTGVYAFNMTTGYEQAHWNNYVFSASLTKIMSSHNFKFGGEVRLMDRNRIAANAGGGGFTFSNTQLTNIDGASSSSTTGNTYASFLLGHPNSGNIGTGAAISAYSWYHGYYFNDTFQLTRKLTVNYGVRWEIPGALAERKDKNTVFLPGATDSALSTATGKTVLGVLALVNSTAYPDRSVPGNKYNLFAPRVGFAFRITDNDVIRGGYGISYLSNNYAGGWPQNSPINAATTNMVASLDNNLTPYNALSNPFPATGNVKDGTASTTQSILQPYGRNTAYLDTLKGSNANVMIPNQPFPYVQQWNLVVGHQFKGNVLLEVGYAGSKGTHLPAASINLNQVSDANINSSGSGLGSSVTNPFYGLLPGTSQIGKATTTAGQLLRPFPEWLNVVSQGQQIGNTVYHSMQMKMEKRFGAGGVVMANYTWAKIIGDVDTTNGAFLEGGTVGSIQNYSNLRGERSLLSGDVPHRAIVSYVVDLPMGKGRKLLGGATGFVGGLVSGWGVNGIVTLQSGFPLSIVASNNTLNSAYGAGSTRPNRVAGCDPVATGSAQSRLNMWFNTACFAQPGSYSFGNESRVDPVLRAGGANNVDFSMFKMTRITESVKLQFRAEAFNLFNRVQFAPPGTSMSNASTWGKVTSQSNQPRLIQFALRLTF